jgi:hypothetical protein
MNVRPPGAHPSQATSKALDSPARSHRLTGEDLLEQFGPVADLLRPYPALYTLEDTITDVAAPWLADQRDLFQCDRDIAAPLAWSATAVRPRSGSVAKSR